MRVDNVPVLLRPAFHAYGYGAGFLLDALETTIRRTCRFEREVAVTTGPRIECIWHENLPAYIAAYLPPRAGKHYVWMNHPIWYMRPIHVLLARNGVEALALGSSGHGGQAALAQVIELVRRGYNTSVAVDGPLGPPHTLRRGGLDMALATGAALVAVRFAYERARRGSGWDQKHYPLPFSRVAIRERAFHVSTDSYETVRSALSEALG